MRGRGGRGTAADRGPHADHGALADHVSVELLRDPYGRPLRRLSRVTYDI